MTVAYVEYDLNDGFIMNWLAGGPQVIPVDISGLNSPDAKKETARKYYSEKSGITRMPVEPGPLDEAAFTIGEYQGEWSYYRCREDRLVDLSNAYEKCQFARAWAYTQLVSPAEQQVTFHLTTYGPVDLWINKKKVFGFEEFTDHLTTLAFPVTLDEGANKLQVRFANVAVPDCKLAVALRVEAEGLKVRIPTLIPSLDRRRELESVGELIYLERDVFPANGNVYLIWPEGMEKQAYCDVRFQNLTGQIYAQAQDVGKPGTKQFLGTPSTLQEGPYQAVVMPLAWEFYESQIRVTKRLPAWVMGRSKFSSGPYGTLEERRKEALFNTSIRDGDLFAEIAKMAMGRWDEIDAKVIEQAVQRIHDRAPGSEIPLLGLLGALYRYQDHSEFSAGLGEKVKECALAFRYTGDESSCDGLRFDLPDGLIVFYACQILAGQLFPEAVFSASQETGKHMRQSGEALALGWMQARASSGFACWDAKELYAAALSALAYLIDLAETEEIWELASVLTDKMLFSIALNSYQGVFGSTQGRAGTMAVRSGLLDATSGITRLMWGMGVYNYHTYATISFACLSNYELPPIIADIAAGLPQEMWSREQQAGGDCPVNKVTYRTPDYMLASAQDYRPGQMGDREHIWQATLGAQSLVYVNHPGCAGESDAHTPNFWLGNGALPRVAQWKDTLIGLYRLPDDAWMQMTHAYFPTIEFDEFVIQGNTAFARKGSGYLALTAARGLELVQSGRSAYRELRSYGKENIWLCQMGREATDGDFAAFQEKVNALAVKVSGLEIECQTLRGDALKFQWEGPLLRNGEEVALTGFKHFENDFTTADLPCQSMEIKTEDYLLRLDFGNLV